jgi:hypothetical protein
VLARAGTHMEHTMVGAYIALLLGHVAGAAPAHALAIRARVPTYAPLLPTLKKYYTFLSLTASVSTHYLIINRIIIYYYTTTVRIRFKILTFLILMILFIIISFSLLNI